MTTFMSNSQSYEKDTEEESIFHRCKEDEGTGSERVDGNEPTGHDRESNSSLSVMFLLAGCGLTLAILPMLISMATCTHDDYNFTYFIYFIANYVKTLYAIFFTVIWVLVLFRMKNWIVNGYVRVPPRPVHHGYNLTGDDIQDVERIQPVNQESSLKNKHLPVKTFPYAITCFGIGGFVYLTCQFLATISLRINIDGESGWIIHYIIVSSTRDVLNLFTVIIQTVFFVMFKGITLKNCTFFHYIITLIIVGELWSWFSLTIRPIQILTFESCRPFVVLGNGTYEEVIENMDTIFEPFMVEFLTICIGISFDLWYTMDKTKEQQNHFRPGIPHQDDTGSFHTPDFPNENTSEWIPLRLTSRRTNDQVELIPARNTRSGTECSCRYAVTSEVITKRNTGRRNEGVIQKIINKNTRRKTQKEDTFELLPIGNKERRSKDTTDLILQINTGRKTEDNIQQIPLKGVGKNRGRDTAKLLPLTDVTGRDENTKERIKERNTERCGCRGMRSRISWISLVVATALLPICNLVSSIAFSGSIQNTIPQMAKIPPKVCLYFSAAIWTALFLPILFVNKLATKQTKQIKTSCKLTSLKIKELVLSFTNVINYVYAFCHIFTATAILISYAPLGQDFSHMPRPSPVELLYLLIFSCFCLLENWIHTSYLLRMKSCHDAGVKLSKFDKYGLIYSIGCNLSCWAIQSLELGWVSRFSNKINADAFSLDFLSAYGDSTTRVLILVAYPTMCFYRFHAAVFACEILKDYKTIPLDNS